MRKRSAFVWSFVAALMTVSCSNNDDNQSGEKIGLEFSVNFSESPAETKAPGSTVVPATTWASVKQIQFFLYEGTTIRYSMIETIPSTASGTQRYTYTDVPATTGTYTLVAVANAVSSSDAVTTYTSNVATTWNSYNVRSKAIADLCIKYKSTTFPSYASPTGNTAYTAPAEVFMAYASGISITSGGSYTLSAPLELKREVSMMRLRLCVSDTDAGVNNTGTGTGGVNWATNVSALVYTLPDQINLQMGNAGGTTATSTATNIIVADGAFNGTTTGITDATFTMYKDIVVFPNNGGRGNNPASAAAGNDVNAAVAQKYFVVVSAQGQTGHVLKDGTALTAPTTIYWSGLVDKAFSPNIIREVNMILKSGGSTEIPTTPTQTGTLIIDVSAPTPWDSNIQDVSITV